MPDITMCNNNKCPYCKECYRYCAMPNQQGQSYFSGTVLQNGYCEYFIDNADYLDNTKYKGSE